MPKEFYTERDIEDLFKRGVMSLDIDEDVVLTELAYEKANPPCAPVRPYLSQKSSPTAEAASSVIPAAPAEADLHKRIREAVIARMGNQVDPAMLDIIIERVLKSTGVK
jgi:hypothetical protein